MSDVAAERRSLPAPRSTDSGVIIYANDRTIVRRAPMVQGAPRVVCKQALGSDALERTRHERSLLERLDGTDGVPRLLPGSNDDTLVLEDAGGHPLADLPPGLLAADPERLTRLALRLSHAVGAVHAAGIVHRDLNPLNVIVRKSSEGEFEPVVVDFDLATTFTQLRPSFVDARVIAGRLPYLAPEQTGRTGLLVDERADLYGLGAMLYELVTGAPPFTDDDPLRLVTRILTEVPVSVAGRGLGIPCGLSRVIVRLLEKEPDARYQSAAGLAHDLSLLASSADTEFVSGTALGTFDFPRRLAPPTRLVGRGAELTALAGALDEAVSSIRVVLVSGAPGVGKSALVDQLRSMVAVRGGWFVSGKADQYRHDAATNPFMQAMSALGRLLLTAPEAELDEMRGRLERALGANAELIAAVLPELRQLLGIDPEERADDDPLYAQLRLAAAAPLLLQEIASPTCPIVLVLDDLQWAGKQILTLVDALLGDPRIHGLLVVGVYRDEAVDAAHPLTAMMDRWERLDVAPQRIMLRDLPSADVATLLTEMLRVQPNQARALAAVLDERTGGNPFDTVELLNALRRDGALVLGEHGWSWDARTIRNYIGTGDVVDLLADRLQRLPELGRRVMEAMACMGGEVSWATLAAAHGCGITQLAERLRPALEDGLLVEVEAAATPSGERAGTVRFRHDRVQQATYGGFTEAGRAALQVKLARRLASDGAHAAEAAQLYLAVADQIDEPNEQRRVIGLFRAAAAAARRANHPVLVERCLSAALALHERAGGGDRLTGELEVELHAALYTLGQLDEAGQLYPRIEKRAADPVALAGSACLQISALTARGRFAEALVLGQQMLHRLGVPEVGEDLTAAVAEGYRRIDNWLGADPAQNLAADLRKPAVVDARARATAAVLRQLAPPAYLSDNLLLSWLVTEAHRLWAERGPQPDLVPVLGHTVSWPLGLVADPDLDHRILRHCLDIGDACGWAETTAYAHFLHATVVGHLYEPFENLVAEARAAREVLQHAGDLQVAGFTFYPTAFGTLLSEASLESLVLEAQAGITLGRRTGSEQLIESMVVVRQFGRALTGATDGLTIFDDAEFDADQHYAATQANNPLAAVYNQLYRALACALACEMESLNRHSLALQSLLPIVSGTGRGVLAQFLRGLSAAWRACAAAEAGTDVAELIAELDSCRKGVADVAARSPANYRQLALALDAERARAVGDEGAALRAYDDALAAADRWARPWQHALIAERAGLYHLERGLSRAGRLLLGEAHRLYGEWGATAKMRQLEQDHGLREFLAPVAGGTSNLGSSVAVRSQDIDMMAVLRASQAIGSQTDLNQLRVVLVEQLRSLTGATAVQLVISDDETGEWMLASDAPGGARIPVDEAGAAGLLSLRAFLYAEPTRATLLVPDATRDARFARDPYLAARQRCSLLAVPILNGGALRAMLLLVNDLSADAFNGKRLEGVQLVAGQLAVSLDNALLYRSLEAKVAARTEALRAAKEQLERLSVTDFLTSVANRRRFDDEWGAAWEKAIAQKRPLAVLMIDIDHFKQYNDTFGHLAGDECIQAVAHALTNSVRGADLVCRYGGEEFAIILPVADQRVAAEVAHRAHTAVRRLHLPHPGSRGQVTVSVGVAAEVPDPGQDPHKLIAAADAALFQAKANGRDQVVAA